MGRVQLFRCLMKGKVEGANRSAEDDSNSTRKGTDVERVFGDGFSWTEALDAVADVYNGVC